MRRTLGRTASGGCFLQDEEWSNKGLRIPGQSNKDSLTHDEAHLLKPLMLVSALNIIGSSSKTIVQGIGFGKSMSLVGQSAGLYLVGAKTPAR